MKTRKNKSNASDTLKRLVRGKITSAEQFLQELTGNENKPYIIALIHDEQVSLTLPPSKKTGLLKKEMQVVEWEEQKAKLEKRFTIAQITVIAPKGSNAHKEEGV
ncbi:hypothetical protein QNI16_12500 [Cytophagaceae bacterium YF14B1]|uniref:Uncharacterized protein n=1 Tax=Xanthocytophaga flava TaxID=3048013 RepID=A0AAE3U929_9BACT|nr:hypothetical protein [Xanthocytophaga flavus]MDJ1481309.1 hypothetical protein [Xanthocytophaga flavus]